MYFTFQSCIKDVSKGGNNSRRKWWSHTIWSDHGRLERGRTLNFCPTIDIPSFPPGSQRSFLENSMAPWISETELWKVYTFLNTASLNGNIRVKWEGNGTEKIYHIKVSWVLLVTNQTSWKLVGVPLTPLLYLTIDVLQTDNVMYMA